MLKDKPLYAISAVSELLGLHPQTLRQYERLGLVIPSRSLGNTRRYSEEDVEKLHYITTLTKDMGINLAGVQVIMNMRSQIDFLNKQILSAETFIKTKYGEEIKLGKPEIKNENIRKIKIERE